MIARLNCIHNTALLNFKVFQIGACLELSQGRRSASCSRRRSHYRSKECSNLRSLIKNVVADMSSACRSLGPIRKASHGVGVEVGRASRFVVQLAEDGLSG